MQQARRDGCDFLYGCLEYGLIRLRRLIEAADLPYKLERGGANLLFGDGRVEVEECFDIPAHFSL